LLGQDRHAVLERRHGIDAARADNPQFVAVGEKIAHRLIAGQGGADLRQLAAFFRVELQDRIFDWQIDRIVGHAAAAEGIANLLFPNQPAAGNVVTPDQILSSDEQAAAVDAQAVIGDGAEGRGAGRFPQHFTRTAVEGEELIAVTGQYHQRPAIGNHQVVVPAIQVQKAGVCVAVHLGHHRVPFAVAR
jgi:hypothetical protein